MCSFCKQIFNQDESNAKDENHIYWDDGFYILAVAGDPYDCGILEKVKFCPYCGRKLSLLKPFSFVEKTHSGILEE